MGEAEARRQLPACSCSRGCARGGERPSSRSGGLGRDPAREVVPVAGYLLETASRGGGNFWPAPAARTTGRMHHRRFAAFPRIKRRRPPPPALADCDLPLWWATSLQTSEAQPLQHLCSSLQQALARGELEEGVGLTHSPRPRPRPRPRRRHDAAGGGEGRGRGPAGGGRVNGGRGGRGGGQRRAGGGLQGRGRVALAGGSGTQAPSRGPAARPSADAGILLRRGRRKT